MTAQLTPSKQSQLIPNLNRTLTWVSREFGLTVHQAAHRMCIDEENLAVTIDGERKDIPDECLDVIGCNARWMMMQRVRLDPFPGYANDPMFPDAS